MTDRKTPAQLNEDTVLRRMLATPPDHRTPKKTAKAKKPTPKNTKKPA